MSTTRAVVTAVAVVLVVAGPARAYDAKATFRKGVVVASIEGGYGKQAKVEDHRRSSHLEFWNAGLRLGVLPFEPLPLGPLRGSLEVGLEAFQQEYFKPHPATFAGLGAMARYHFLALGRVVPYLELFASAGGTDLESDEISSDYAFLMFGGAGASVFVMDRLAVYAGYRFEHVSNGGLATPNRGFEAHMGVIGLSVYFP
jgi:hypothetical protein